MGCGVSYHPAVHEPIVSRRGTQGKAPDNLMISGTCIPYQGPMKGDPILDRGPKGGNRFPIRNLKGGSLDLSGASWGRLIRPSPIRDPSGRDEKGRIAPAPSVSRSNGSPTSALELRRKKLVHTDFVERCKTGKRDGRLRPVAVRLRIRKGEGMPFRQPFEDETSDVFLSLRRER